MSWLPETELKAAVEAAGLTLEPQTHFWKVVAGQRIMHFNRKPKVRTIHLKGMDDLSHRALRPLTQKERDEKHLGRVSRQVDVTSPEAAREAFALCVRAMVGEAPRRAAPREAVVSIGLARELWDAIEAHRRKLEEASPKGIEISMTGAIKALLWKALESDAAAP